jgi:lysozyme
VTNQNAYAGQFLSQYETTRYTPADHIVRRSIIVQPDAEHFADVSFYQAGLNWDTYATKARAVILRIGQNTWQDSSFNEFYTSAKARKLAVGGYWFFDGRASPQAQYTTLAAAMQGKAFEMELLIDWEKNYGGQYEGIENVIRLMELCENNGVKCKAVGLYTGYYFFVTNTPALSVAQKEYLKSRPLWLAWYASSEVVKVPPPWSTWTHWQYGTPVMAWGQPTAEIDSNYHNGTKAQFEARYLSGGVIPPIGETMRYEVIGLNGLNLRPAANTNNTPIKLIPTGSYVWAVFDITGWLKGSAYQEPGKAKVDAAFYCSVLATLVKESPEPVVPDSIEVKVTKDGVVKTYTITGDIVES